SDARLQSSPNQILLLEQYANNSKRWSTISALLGNPEQTLITSLKSLSLYRTLLELDGKEAQWIVSTIELRFQLSEIFLSMPDGGNKAARYLEDGLESLKDPQVKKNESKTVALSAKSHYLKARLLLKDGKTGKALKEAKKANKIISDLNAHSPVYPYELNRYKQLLDRISSANGKR
ncbi:MAG: hypothetical protein P1V97_24775, partial [Planctomycetota bacterium]|nr:hypothetical protein [Planctomycetota bacterium]